MLERLELEELEGLILWPHCDMVIGKHEAASAAPEGPETHNLLALAESQLRRVLKPMSRKGCLVPRETWPFSIWGRAQ